MVDVRDADSQQLQGKPRYRSGEEKLQFADVLTADHVPQQNGRKDVAEQFEGVDPGHILL